MVFIDFVPRPNPKENPPLRWQLKAERVRSRCKELRLTIDDLATKMGPVSKRSIEYWLAKSKKRHPDEEDVEQMARVLGLGLDDFCQPTDKHSVDFSALSQGGTAAWATHRGQSTVIAGLSDYIELFREYRRHVEFIRWPRDGFAKTFSYDRAVKHRYAAVQITMKEKVEDATFYFSFRLGRGPVRVEYGAVEMRRGKLSVNPFFAQYVSESEVAPNNNFIVRNWLGLETCSFFVRCPETDFDLEKLADAGRAAQSRVSTNTVTFLAAPHHLRAAEVAESTRAPHNTSRS